MLTEKFYELDELEQLLKLQPDCVQLSRRYWDLRQDVDHVATPEPEGVQCSCGRSAGPPGAWGKYICGSCVHALYTALAILDEVANHYPAAKAGLDEAYRCIGIVMDKNEPTQPLHSIVIPENQQ